LKKFIEWLSWGILILAVGLLGFVMQASHSGWEFNAVLSGSMEPVLHVGGLIVTRPVDAAELRVGDIISFKVPGGDTPVCHRIVEVRSEGGVLSFITKGDANDSLDPNPVLAEAVKGKEIFYLSYVGYLTYFEKFAKTQIDFMGVKFSVGFVAVLLMGSTVVGLIISDLWFEITDPSSVRRSRMIEKKRKKLLARRKMMLKVGK